MMDDKRLALLGDRDAQERMTQRGSCFRAPAVEAKQSSNRKYKRRLTVKTYITFEQAIKVLPDGESVHTFYNPRFGLVGADWDKNEVIDKLRKSDIIELTGEKARGTGHGICAYDKTTKYQDDILFIETDESLLSELEKELEANHDE